MLDMDHDLIYHSVDPAENTPEHAKLAAEQGFSYRTLLGELLYAYITAHPDIGYAVAILSKFSTAPSVVHYQRLKHVAFYLRATKH